METIAEQVEALRAEADVVWRDARAKVRELRDAADALERHGGDLREEKLVELKGKALAAKESFDARKRGNGGDGGQGSGGGRGAGGGSGRAAKVKG